MAGMEADREVEDVLASIRRLVSLDNAPVARRPVVLKPVPVEAEPAPAAVAAKVVPEIVVAELPAPIEADAPSGEVVEMDPVAAEPEIASAEVGAAFLVLTPAQRIGPHPEETEAPIDLQAILPEEPERVVAKPDLVAELSRLESSIAEMEAAVAEVSLEPEEEDFATAAGVEEAAESEPASDADGDIADIEAEETVPDVAVSEVPEAEVTVAEAAGIEDDLEAFRSRRGEAGAPRLEIHRGGSGQDSAVLLDGEDEAEEDAPLAALDEDALRILVAQLIREELRGILGERITQNVRKLVRREIQRTLAGHDFE